MKHRQSFAVLCLIALGAVPPALAGGGAQPVHAAHGMVVSMHELASQAGVEMMKAGGNAIDAAVATGFALAVVLPEAGNLGGGGFMIVRLNDGSAQFLDFREKAPGRATPGMFQDAQGNLIPQLSIVGYKAAGVPGSVKGLAYAEQHFGKLGLARVMQPAIQLAREGYALAWGEARQMSTDTDLARFPDSKRIFQNGGQGFQQGDVFRQPELARTLERIAADPEEFYRGAMARELVAFVQRGGGILSADDLARYEVDVRAPIRGSYRGLEIISAPPPSSGGIVLLETLNILEGFDLKKAGLASAASIHLVNEAYRRTFYDRAEFLGDTDFSRVPLGGLVDKAYAAAWRASIDTQRASASAALQRPSTSPELERYAAAHPIHLVNHEARQTTHYSVVDAAGNAVAVTTTLNGAFGSKVTVGPLGFLLNDEMDDFAAKVGVPNMFGLIQGPANAVAANKRPLSSMTPTMVVKGGKLWLVLGAEGGPTIITTVANVLLGVVDFGLDIQQAVNAGRFHQQWLPDHIAMESERFSPDTIRLLEAHGNTVVFEDTGDAECLAIDPRSGERLGASDARNESGKAVGY